MKDNPIPRVSILLPNLNNRPYLDERVRAIMGQTFNDWELIIVDNYSDDGAWEFFQELAKKDPRVKPTRAPRQSMYANWNNGIRLARGEYVYITTGTGEDSISPGFLGKMAAALDEYPECDLAHCKLKIIDENGAPHPTLNWKKFYCSEYFGDLNHQKHIRFAPHDGLLHCGIKSVYTSITQLLIRRSLFNRVGMFLTNYGPNADIEWDMRASLVANTLHIPEYLATWRVNRDQGTNRDGLNSTQYRPQLLRLIDHAFKVASKVNPTLLREINKEELKQIYLKEVLENELLEAKTTQKTNTKLYKYKIAFKWLFRHPKIMLLYYCFAKSKQPKEVFTSTDDPFVFSRRILTKYGLETKILEIKQPEMKMIDEKIVDPILIYQMGKVGSTSIYKSLKHAGIPNSISHVHQLSEKGIRRKEEWLKYHNAENVPEIIEDLMYIKKLKEFIDTNRWKFQWKIITMTRDPMGVELSVFFENIYIYGHEVFDPPWRVHVDKTIESLKRNVFNVYDVEKNYFCTWFDDELKTVFGIDVYTVPYDFARGYSIITKDNVSVLVMRLEDMGRSFRQAMNDFLKVPNIELIQDNTTDSKVFWHQYRTVLEKFTVSVELFDLIYSSRYARHFYPEGEREKSREKWVADAAMA